MYLPIMVSYYVFLMFGFVSTHMTIEFNITESSLTCFGRPYTNGLMLYSRNIPEPATIAFSVTQEELTAGGTYTYNEACERNLSLYMNNLTESQRFRFNSASCGIEVVGNRSFIQIIFPKPIQEINYVNWMCTDTSTINSDISVGTGELINRFAILNLEDASTTDLAYRLDFISLDSAHTPFTSNGVILGCFVEGAHRRQDELLIPPPILRNVYIERYGGGVSGTHQSARYGGDFYGRSTISDPPVVCDTTTNFKPQTLLVPTARPIAALTKLVNCFQWPVDVTPECTTNSTDMDVYDYTFFGHDHYITNVGLHAPKSIFPVENQVDKPGMWLYPENSTELIKLEKLLVFELLYDPHGHKHLPRYGNFQIAGEDEGVTEFRIEKESEGWLKVSSSVHILILETLITMVNAYKYFKIGRGVITEENNCPPGGILTVFRSKGDGNCSCFYPERVDDNTEFTGFRNCDLDLWFCALEEIDNNNTRFIIYINPGGDLEMTDIAVAPTEDVCVSNSILPTTLLHNSMLASCVHNTRCADYTKRPLYIYEEECNCGQVPNRCRPRNVYNSNVNNQYRNLSDHPIVEIHSSDVSNLLTNMLFSMHVPLTDLRGDEDEYGEDPYWRCTAMDGTKSPHKTWKTLSALETCATQNWELTPIRLGVKEVVYDPITYQIAITCEPFPCKNVELDTRELLIGRLNHSVVIGPERVLLSGEIINTRFDYFVNQIRIPIKEEPYIISIRDLILGFGRLGCSWADRETNLEESRVLFYEGKDILQELVKTDCSEQLDTSTNAHIELFEFQRATGEFDKSGNIIYSYEQYCAFKSLKARTNNCLIPTEMSIETNISGEVLITDIYKEHGPVGGVYYGYKTTSLPSMGLVSCTVRARSAYGELLWNITTQPVDHLNRDIIYPIGACTDIYNLSLSFTTALDNARTIISVSHFSSQTCQLSEDQDNIISIILYNRGILSEDVDTLVLNVSMSGRRILNSDGGDSFLSLGITYYIYPVLPNNTISTHIIDLYIPNEYFKERLNLGVSKTGVVENIAKTARIPYLRTYVYGLNNSEYAHYSSMENDEDETRDYNINIYSSTPLFFIDAMDRVVRAYREENDTGFFKERIRNKGKQVISPVIQLEEASNIRHQPYVPLDNKVKNNIGLIWHGIIYVFIPFLILSVMIMGGMAIFIYIKADENFYIYNKVI